MSKAWMAELHGLVQDLLLRQDIHDTVRNQLDPFFMIEWASVRRSAQFRIVPMIRWVPKMACDECRRCIKMYEVAISYALKVQVLELRAHYSVRPCSGLLFGGLQN